MTESNFNIDASNTVHPSDNESVGNIEIEDVNTVDNLEISQSLNDVESEKIPTIDTNENSESNAPKVNSLQEISEDNIELPDYITEVTTHDIEAGKENLGKFPIQLEWRDIKFEVGVGIPIPFMPRDKKTILHPMSGYVKPGEILAIMGPTGAGKTSLLNVLSQRELGYTGTVKANGKRLPRSYQNLSAYVEQDDVMHANLTVFQVLRYAALLRLPTFMSYKKKIERVKEVMKILGLERCRDTKVGSPGGEKGISGGERKRLSIAVEILKKPSLLFLDEPTTGMDAKTSLNIVKALRNLARSGTTIIMTIHQPRSQIFAYFDKLLLLVEGKEAYFGEASKIDEHLTEINPEFALPMGVNIADHIIDLVSRTTAKSEYQIIPKELKKLEDERIKQITNAWTKNHLHSNLNIPKFETDSDLSKFPRYSSSVFLQFFVLLFRNLNNILLDKMMTTGKLVQTLIFLLFLGSLYFRMDNHQTTIQDRLGLIFFVMLSQVMNTLFLVLQNFPSEFKVFKRENASRAYSVFSYYFAKVLSELPHQIFFPLLFGCAIYWTVGFHESASRFFVYLLILISICLTGVSLGEVISVLSPNEQFGLLIAPVLIIVLVFFSGFYIAVENIPPYYIWIYYISLFAYGFESMLINEFEALPFRCLPDQYFTNQTGHSVCPVTDGTDIIRKIGMNTNYYKIWINIGAIAVIFIGLKLIGFTALVIRTSRVRSNIKRFIRDIKHDRDEKLKKDKSVVELDAEPINLYDTNETKNETVEVSA